MENNLEQPKDSGFKERSLEQPEDSGSKEYGKFKDTDSLVKAYQSLQAEFTKKSQKLAELENANQELKTKQLQAETIEREIEEIVTKFEVLKPFKSALKASLESGESVTESALNLLANSYKSPENYINDQEFLNNYVYSNQEIKDKIIREYLSKLTFDSPIKVNTGASHISLSNPDRPKTISDAGKLAKTIIKNF